MTKSGRHRGLNLTLAGKLAVRSLTHHRMISLATILGVAIGMLVVGAILIVDHNTLSGKASSKDSSRQVFVGNSAGQPNQAGTRRSYGLHSFAPDIQRIAILQGNRPRKPQIELIRIPSQRGSAPATRSDEATLPPAGAEDYQAMRLAARLSSLLAFMVSAVVVFYTMRYSVVSREREFSLLLCLGEFRSNIAFSIVIEALILGASGTLIGLMLALPTARSLLQQGISTTGMNPSVIFSIPHSELILMAIIGMGVALLGVWSPIRNFYRLQIAQVLQPRFMESTTGIERPEAGFTWLIPALLAASYIAIRPFMQEWLSVVYFFLVESTVVVLLAAATLWWVKPLLRGAIGISGWLLRRGWALEGLLTTRRMRLSAHKLVFTVAGVTLVFSLLTSLHDITRSLKHEISLWSQEAMDPYGFLSARTRSGIPEDRIQNILGQQDLLLFRLSHKIPGTLPIRLAKSSDINPYLISRQRKPLVPGTVIFSTTLAHRYGVGINDVLELESGDGTVHRFQVIGVGDDLGFYAEDGQYVDLKSYALFSDGNPLFENNLERTLGWIAKVRASDNRHPHLTKRDVDPLRPYYHFNKWGREQGHWQKNEINRDFLIFDFILTMTLLLAVVGVANTMFIRVHARMREFSVLRTIGCSRSQITRMLLLEGVIIGLVSALLAVVLGNLLGAVSIAFLNRFTLFDYQLIFSIRVSLIITGLAVAACAVAAILPAIAATRTSSAESLHYE
ncbi:MAG: ABC transporter permease [Gammaproteobacteria bacterium]|nr:ABC transporter permease [Gammaproteobacteria bacterium]